MDDNLQCDDSQHPRCGTDWQDSRGYDRIHVVCSDCCTPLDGIYDPFLLFLMFNVALEQIVIFGTGHLARTVYEHIQDDDRFEVVTFTMDAPDKDALFDLPVVDFKEIESRLVPPSTGCL